MLLLKSCTQPKMTRASVINENDIVNTKNIHTITQVWMTFICTFFIVSVRFVDADKSILPFSVQDRTVSINIGCVNYRLLVESCIFLLLIFHYVVQMISYYFTFPMTILLSGYHSVLLKDTCWSSCTITIH